MFKKPIDVFDEKLSEHKFFEFALLSKLDLQGHHLMQSFLMLSHSLHVIKLTHIGPGPK